MVLDTVSLTLRTTKHRCTGVTPYWALFGREARLPVDVIYQNNQEIFDHPTHYAQDLQDIYIHVQ